MVRREVQGRENRVLSVVEAPGVVLHGVWLSVFAHVDRGHKPHLIRIEHDQVFGVFIGLLYLIGIADCLVELRLQRGARTARGPDFPHVRRVAETSREAHGSHFCNEVGEQLSFLRRLLENIGVDSKHNNVVLELLPHRRMHCPHHWGGEHAVRVSVEGDDEVLPAVPGALYNYSQQVAVRELHFVLHTGDNDTRHLSDAVGPETVLLKHHHRVLVPLSVELRG
mmetsp:Transcript_119904/g.255882  ORF Transcript_119904/g.255882 Transcript_119904/m.255882 type:complete len:224 (-) Transcript_119904:1127-1798(-)